ncbi:MAG TPA: hypothetical protein VLU24_02945, partial [Mycobacterium sp.]|nr:hypothetical protein [Mycobacterium sp.]
DSVGYPAPQPPEPSVGHGGPDDTAPHEGQHGEGHGQSVAELLARLQAGTGPGGGSRRRRRDG